jgi:hypothetical protein
MHIISLLFTFLLVFCAAEGSSIASISSQDRESINQLFNFLIKEDHFGYTLFGDKPVSLSGHFTITPWENIVERVNDQDGIFWKNWRIWEKYQQIFPLQNFILINEPSKRHKNILNVILINKKEFIRVVNQNQRLFEAVLGYKISPHHMLQKIESGEITFVDSINDNQGLWGILLGYGKHNSMLYNQRERSYFDCFALSDTALKNSSINLEACGDYDYSPLIIGSVHFAGDKSNLETKKLQERYRKLRGKISEIYSKGDFLEITLSKLTSTD